MNYVRNTSRVTDSKSRFLERKKEKKIKRKVF